MLMGPGTIGLAATQVNIFVNTLLATSQGTGAVSWLTYAFRLMYLPIGLFGVSIATAVLPAVSRHAAADDDRRACGTPSSRGLAMMLMLNVPATLRPDRAGDADRAAALRARPFPAGRHRRRPPRRCGSTPSAWSATRPCGSRRRPSTRSAQPHAGRSSACARSRSTSSLSVTLVHVMGFRGLALGTSIAALANGGAARLCCCGAGSTASRAGVWA